MNLELEFKSFSSPDIQCFREWEPEKLSEVCFLLEFEIGEKGKKESFVFGVTIATQEGLTFSKKHFPSAIYDPVLLVGNYAWKDVLQKLNKTLKECERENWMDSITSLKEYFYFEHG